MRTPTALILTMSLLSAPLFAADDMFFYEAARGGMAEVALGQLAADKASREDLKAFGRQMVADHGAANAKLRTAAAKSSVTLPTDLSAEAQSTLRKLQSLTGRAFDQAYVESQSKAHAQTVQLLKKEIASGSDPAAKTWATEALPTVERHAELIGSLDAMPGEHEREHAAGTAGPADAPPATPPPR